MVQKYEHEIDGSLYDTEEECLEVAAEHVEECEIWEALREDFTIYDILKVVMKGNEEMYLQALDKAKERYVDNYFMKVEVEEDE
jgi:hypothetical protein